MSNFRGDPHINLCLAVLGEAKKGQTEMWKDFCLEYMRGKAEHVNHSSFDIALWVGGWWKRDSQGLIP